MSEPVLNRFIDTLADYALLHGRSSPGFIVRNGNRILTMMGRREGVRQRGLSTLMRPDREQLEDQAAAVVPMVC